MKNNLYSVTIVKGSNSTAIKERRNLRINDPLTPGKIVTAMKDNANLTKVRLVIVGVENNNVIARIAKR